jgi:hypothetical protein
MALPARVNNSDVFAPPVVKRSALKDRPRDVEFAWLREHAREYPGQWLAVDGATLVGAAPRFKDLLASLSPAEREHGPLFHYVDADWLVLLRDDGSLFMSSRAPYLDAPPGVSGRDAKIFIRIAVGTPGFLVTAMLDSGSTYSVLNEDVAEAIGAFEDAHAPSIEMGTRRGVLRGRLVRRPISLLADEGDGLEVEATFWVSREWKYGHFLGYAGLLQRVRFGLDPQTNQSHFGPIEA